MTDETLPPKVSSMAPVPDDCDSTAPPDTMAIHDFGGGFSDGTVQGGAPVWTLGLPNDGVLRLEPPMDPGRLPSFKIMWIVGPDQTAPVVVSGSDVETGVPMWFEVYPSNADPMHPSRYTTTLVLDPMSPNRGFARNAQGRWSIWGIGIGAISAGCYVVTVARSDPIWSVRLAIGF